MPRPKYQQDALLVLMIRLNPDSPENTSSEEVKAHLRALRPWLDSWVMPSVSCLAGDAEQWEREAVSSDARNIRRRVEG